MDYINYYESPLGGITLASDGEYLIGLWFDNQKFYRNTVSKENEVKELPIFDVTKKWLDLYFSGNVPNFTPPFLMKTTDFRMRVWKIMLSIPYGKTMTYKEIAKIIAKEKGLNKMSAQAVGNAVGHNSISLIIPCHRVIGSDGSLTGYAGGLKRKEMLLKLEKAIVDK